MRTSPEAFAGTLLIVAPHMDDEVLACGGLIAHLSGKAHVHVVYATDGMKSPAPVLSWRDRSSPDLGAIRKQESEAAMAALGVPAGNLNFLDLPEADLSRHAVELARHLEQQLARIRPDHVLVPFRFDRHPDHLAVNRVMTGFVRDGTYTGALAEYFVYHRWRLLPRGDIRSYLKPDQLIVVDIEPFADRKRAALACFRTQTTHYYPWQTRPILTATLLEEECRGAEYFLRFDPALPDAAVFTGAVPWIRIAHELEPRLQRWKYYARTTVVRAFGGQA